MKLVMCDVCKKIFKPDEMSSVKLCLSHDEYVYKIDDHYESICADEIRKDVCFDCMVNILKPFYPKREFLTKEENEKFRKDMV